jgi:hypothetical protein
MRIRHFVTRAGRGEAARHYWQPSSELRRAGWRPERLPDELGAAIARAEVLNADVDAWREGRAAPGAPAAVKRRARVAPPGSMAALIEDYRRSEWWRKLAPRTRKDYEWCLDLIRDWAGDEPVRWVTPPAVLAFHDAQARRTEQQGRRRVVVETPAKAAAAVRVLRLLLQVGVRLGYCATNAAARPGIAVRRQREPRLWSAEEVRHMAAVADALGWRSMGTAILLNAWIGQRVSDVLALPPWRAETGVLALAQGKTKRRVALPVHLVPHLVERLRAEVGRAGVASPTHLLLHDRTGQPWRLSTFEHVFAEVREAASRGLPAEGGRAALPPMPSCTELLFRELRHAAVTRLHEAGVDELGISGITGHTPQSVRMILDRHYLVRTERAAERAFRQRLAAEDKALDEGQNCQS